MKHENVVADYLFNRRPTGLPFREFVRRVDGIPDLLKEPHLKPQHYFIDYYKRKNPNVVILKLEKPDEINSFLAIYTLEMPRLNFSPEPYDYREYYDLETFELASRVYRTDLKMFRYEQAGRSVREFLLSVKK